MYFTLPMQVEQYLRQFLRECGQFFRKLFSFWVRKSPISVITIYGIQFVISFPAKLFQGDSIVGIEFDAFFQKGFFLDCFAPSPARCDFAFGIDDSKPWDRRIWKVSGTGTALNGPMGRWHTNTESKPCYEFWSSHASFDLFFRRLLSVHPHSSRH